MRLAPDNSDVDCHLLESNMFKQYGISSVELLVSISIMSSLAAYTVTMAEEVELSAKQYQEQNNVKDMMKKIRSSKKNAVS